MSLTLASILPCEVLDKCLSNGLKIDVPIPLKKPNNKINAVPGDTMVKTLPFNARGAGSIPGHRTKIPHIYAAKKPKPKKRSNIVINLTKTLKK